MKFKHHFATATAGLRAHKTRSLLTILGIVIGITAIILVMALGKGAQDLIVGQLQGMGSKTIVVIPGREPKGPSDAAQVFSDSLRERDLTALKRRSNVPNLSRITPLLFGGESSQYGNETYRLTIFGAAEIIEDLFDLEIGEGSFFTDEDVRSRADVAVIGAKVRQELFGDEPVLGKKIKIKNRSFRVIGVMPAKGQVSFFNFDEAAIVPYTTAQQYIFGIKYYHRFVIESDSEAAIPATVADIEATLREAHDISDPEKDDFFVETQADLAQRLGTITSALTWFLVAVASISLFVGGIGIMNIMLVSVTERTREIGLRKAVGATNRDMLIQFLLEATLLTVAGGIIGILLGASFAFVIAFGLSQGLGVAWEYSFPLGGAVLGIAVSATIGIAFGLYPARKASQKSPMEALRYE